MKNNKGFGLVEIMIIVAVLALVADLTIPKIKSYLSTKESEEKSSAVIEIAINNAKTYVNQINQDLLTSVKDNGSYYVVDIKVSLSGTLPTDDSWIVITDNKVTSGMFKEAIGKKYVYIMLNNDEYTMIDTDKLIPKP